MARGTMNVVAFDTCFDACSVAVKRADDGAVTSERQLMRRGHAEALVPMIERTMRAAGLEFSELDRIAVTRGPGTFTGSRIGMSAALGLSFAHRLPVVTFSSLHCVARAVLDVLGQDAAAYDGILVVRDAKRDSVFVEGADVHGGELTAPALLGLEAARRLAGERRWFVMASGARPLAAAGGTPPGPQDAIAEWPPGIVPPDGIAEPDARYLLGDAERRQPDPAPAPLYLRPPDAKRSTRPPLARLDGNA